MYRAPLRQIRPAVARAAALRQPAPRSARALLSTASGAKKGTWRGTALRWGLAIGAIYWYNTSPIFSDEPIIQTAAAQKTEDLKTVDAVIEEKKRQIRSQPAITETAPEVTSVDAPSSATPAAATASTDAPAASSVPTDSAPTTSENEPHGVDMPGVESPEGLEQEADQQGAFNPETGEINWDCPCLGGMAHGPCGEEFRTAFSCFVYSQEEPKGMDCIEKFQGMQECFRQHPDIYGEELRGDDEEGEGAPAADGAASEGEAAVAKQSQQATSSAEATEGSVTAAVAEAKSKTEEKAAAQ